MSIPKEPRQLMINLMYLVLTAMLALNVSAEIINAFFALNKGIKNSNSIVDNSNELVVKAIEKQVAAYPNSANQGYKSSAQEAVKIAKEFEVYINSVMDEMIKEAGGIDAHYSDGRPVRYKDKDVTTNMFITKGKGEEVKKKIEEAKARFVKLVPDADRKAIEASIALRVDSIASDSKAKTWSEYKFKQMPVAAVMPALTKLVADAKTSQTALLNYFFNKVGGTDIKFDKFLVALAPKKGYINQNEKFEADVYLAAYSSNPGTGVSISVNGQSLPVKEGMAQFSEVGSSLGKRKVTATASIRNPTTGQTETAKPIEFEYEVGTPSVTVSAEKMNVFYIGVENPIAVSATGISSNAINVTGENCNVSKKDANNYSVTVSRPGEAFIVVTGGPTPIRKKFRVKPVPDPVAYLANNKRGGGVGSGEMGAMSFLFARLDNFDFDLKCSIQSFQMVHAPRRADPIPVQVNSDKFDGAAARLAAAAKPGDQYFFLNIRGRCPGDQAARDLGSMSFFIK